MNAWLYDLTCQWVSQGSHVLDLGCGDGWFLERLKKEKNCTGEGVEHDSTQVTQCIERGIDVHHGDLMEGLDQHSDQSFDYILLLGTFQELLVPDKVLTQSFRVGKQVLIGHVNFAYYKYRLQLGLNGKTPKTDEQELPWYKSPNIQLFSIQDFIKFCNSKKVIRKKSAFLNSRGRVKLLPNVRASEALWMLEAR